jgi:1-acyl-sn-glycerol-3-phosphate acyltransferase
MRDLTYPPIIWTAKTAFRALGLRFQMTGTHHLPRSGPALLAVNHISYVDFIFGGLAAQPAKRLVRFMAKKEIFDHPVGGPVMRSMHHIPVDRGDGLGSYQEGLEYLRQGELVGIFPEATISRSLEIKELKSGAARLAAEAGVPLIPVVLWGTQRLLTKDHPRDFSRGKTISINVGRPLTPTGQDPLQDTAELRGAMVDLLDRAIRSYPVDEQPEGCWWLPATYGGSAPTPEEALELDRAEKRRRAERRAARRASRGGDRKAG